MQLWDFEPWLVERLRATDGITKVESFRTVDVDALYGLAVTSASGATILIHLTRGSGPNDRREPPAEHLENVARVGDRTFKGKALPDDVAEKVETLLWRLLDNGQPPGYVLTQPFHDRDAPVQGQRVRGAASRAGVVVVFNDKAEVYLHLFG